MKINRNDAVALMVALGFTKAAEWSDAKLRERVVKVPSKVEEGDCPDGFEELYKELTAADGNVDLVAESGEVKLEALDKKGLAEFVASKGLKVTLNKKMSLAQMREAINKAMAAAAPPAPAKGAKEKKGKDDTAKEKKGKDAVERDFFGSRPGTFASKVNSALTKDWQSEEEIAKLADVPMTQTRDRLYYVTSKGLVEVRRRIEYRLKPVT